MKPVQFIPYVPLFYTFSPIVTTHRHRHTQTDIYIYSRSLVQHSSTDTNGRTCCAELSVFKHEFNIIVINRKALPCFVVPAFWLSVPYKVL
jgi:hypothetical protein